MLVQVAPIDASSFSCLLAPDLADHFAVSQYAGLSLQSGSPFRDGTKTQHKTSPLDLDAMASGHVDGCVAFPKVVDNH